MEKDYSLTKRAMFAMTTGEIERAKFLQRKLLTCDRISKSFLRQSRQLERKNYNFEIALKQEALRAARAYIDKIKHQYLQELTSLEYKAYEGN